MNWSSSVPEDLVGPLRIPGTSILVSISKLTKSLGTSLSQETIFAKFQTDGGSLLSDLNKYKTRVKNAVLQEMETHAILKSM